MPGSSDRAIAIAGSRAIFAVALVDVWRRLNGAMGGFYNARSTPHFGEMIVRSSVFWEVKQDAHSNSISRPLVAWKHSQYSRINQIACTPSLEE